MKIKRHSSITYDNGIDLHKYCNGLTDSRQEQLNMWRNALFHTISRSWKFTALCDIISQPYINFGKQ